MIHNNVINLKNPINYEFITISLWTKCLVSNIKRQKALIGLRNKNTGFHVIHPLSNFIVNGKWRDKEFNTQRKHANNLVRFLNYLILNDDFKINDLTELDLALGNKYLESMVNEELRRDTITDAARTLTAFYVWLSQNECLPKIQETYIENKKKINISNNKQYYESLFNPILPQRINSNRRHLIPTKYIPLLLEISILYAHPIALGIYLQIFGGLRVGEVVNIKRTQVKTKLNSKDFLFNIKEQQFRTDIKDSSGASYVKKIRKQQVLQIKDWGDILYKDHLEFYKDKDINFTGALFINRDGLPMSGKSYSQYFSKVKEKFLCFLRDYGSVEDRIVAADLRISDWNTHICRGTFTNLIAEEIENPAELMFLRGDSDLLSSLPYLAKTERVRKKVEERLEHMHNEYIPMLVQREKNHRK